MVGAGRPGRERRQRADVAVRRRRGRRDCARRCAGAVDDVLDEMAAWPEAAGIEKELKAYRAYATFFAEAPWS